MEKLRTKTVGWRIRAIFFLLLCMGCPSLQAQDPSLLYPVPISEIYFPDETFSLALSCESIYFWKAPDKALSEIYRTLISGSWLAVAVETSDKNKARIWSDRISGMTVYSPGELRSLFCNAGFIHIESQMKGQACLVKGMKP